MDQPTCGTCLFWERADKTEGTCQARPPTVFGERDRDGCPTYLTLFPVTRYSEWCGVHPDFGAYLASLNASASPAQPSEG